MPCYSADFLEALGIGPGLLGEGGSRDSSREPVQDDATTHTSGASHVPHHAAVHDAGSSGSSGRAAPCRPFLELVKQQPEHFVVTEVDWAGELVSLSEAYTIPEVTSVGVVADDGSGTAEEREQRVAKRARLREDGLAAADRMQMHGVDPLGVLSASVRGALEAFATALQPAQPPPVSVPPPPPPAADSASAANTGASAAPDGLELGHFPDPEQRVPLLRACASMYRGLQTDSRGGQVSVRRCPRHAALVALVGTVEADRVAALYQVPNEMGDGTPVELPPDADREHRTKVHRAISQHYGKVLESKTHESGSGGSRICVRLKRRRQDKRKRAPEAEAYAATAPRDAGPNHTIFVLQKRDVEHTRALELLSETLDCPVHTFGVCGIKDKVGVTTQLVSVRATTDITAALRQLQQPVDGAQPLVVGAALRQTNRALRRGQHYGNSFDLTLVGVLDTAIDRADRALQSVLDRGFVNYFGVQRFGAELGLSLSSDVGRQLVKGRWSSALLALLDIDPGETDPDVVAARACFDGRPELLQDDVAAALDRMPARRPKEKALLRALKRHGVGPVGCEKALMALPQPVRQFYVHAYASLVFNKMATARMQHSGVLPGDLVANPNDGEAVKVLSAEEVVSGVYTLADVLLPIPGYKSVFPPHGHVGGDVGRALLLADGVEADQFRIPALDVMSKGAYRKLLAFPLQLSHEWVQRAVGTSDLRLSFRLTKSSYATMLVHALG